MLMIFLPLCWFLGGVSGFRLRALAKAAEIDNN